MQINLLEAVYRNPVRLLPMKPKVSKLPQKPTAVRSADTFPFPTSWVSARLTASPFDTHANAVCADSTGTYALLLDLAALDGGGACKVTSLLALYLFTRFKRATDALNTAEKLLDDTDFTARHTTHMDKVLR
jgi:hypothetical protein